MKPSERIKEIIKSIPIDGFKHVYMIKLEAIIQYLDEQYEKMQPKEEVWPITSKDIEALANLKYSILTSAGAMSGNVGKNVATAIINAGYRKIC